MHNHDARAGPPWCSSRVGRRWEAASDRTSRRSRGVSSPRAPAPCGPGGRGTRRQTCRAAGCTTGRGQQLPAWASAALLASVAWAAWGLVARGRADWGSEATARATWGCKWEKGAKADCPLCHLPKGAPRTQQGPACPGSNAALATLNLGGGGEGGLGLGGGGLQQQEREEVPWLRYPHLVPNPPCSLPAAIFECKPKHAALHLGGDGEGGLGLGGEGSGGWGLHRPEKGYELS